MSDPTVLMTADLHGLAGRAPELRALLTELADGTRSEPGCESFRFFDAEEPGDVFLLSGWADEQALRDHYQTPHYRRYRAAVGELLARPSDVTVHRVSQNVHALDPNPPDPRMLG
jgi:quinol monooxygenase YgiN